MLYLPTSRGFDESREIPVRPLPGIMGQQIYVYDRKQTVNDSEGKK